MIDKTNNQEQTNITGFILSLEELDDLMKNNQTVLKNRTLNKLTFPPQEEQLLVVPSVSTAIQEEINNLRVLVKNVNLSSENSKNYDITIELTKNIESYPNTQGFYGS